MANWRKKIKNPSSEYRSAPFWAWNDDLSEKELKNQLEYMKEGGLGGGFMHSRIGLITPYLSEEWKNCIEATVKHAKKIKMLAYLYDEDRWPSGFAGNKVTKIKKNRMKMLQAEKTKKKWKFKIVEAPVSEWYNNAAYLDTLSYDTVSDFIQSTYDYYKKHFKKYFNKTIPAIFTDEPHYKNWAQWEDKVIPWTSDFQQTFKQKYGYDIWENLTCLFEKSGNWQKIRYDYWRHATELFVLNFGKQIYDWCEANNLPLSGHYLAEENLISQLNVIGCAMMLYEYMQIPGIDHLGRNLLTPILFKQVSSVANQMGRKRILSELYGCSGQSFNFAQRKWIADWHLIHGINLLCPHLYLYSLRGARKRDFPPTISHHQPYWKFNKYLEDYFARISYILAESKFIPQILVLHPIESAWCLYSPGNIPDRLNQINKDFISLNYSLLSNHYDFDHGSESLLRKAKIQNENLAVGQMQYETVIIPSCLSLRKNTIVLLSNFINKNGKVIMLTPLPELVEGEKDSLIQDLIKKAHICKPDNLFSILQKQINREISIQSKGKEIEMVFSTHRKMKKEEIFFIANLDEEKAYQAKIAVKGEQNIEILDPLEYQFYSIDTLKKDGYSTFSLNLEPFQSLVITKTKEKRKLKQYDPANRLTQLLQLNPNNFDICATQLNALPLDNARLKIQSKKWSKITPVVTLKHELNKKYINKEFTARFEFKTQFHAKPDNIFLIIENAEKYKIKVNGNEIKYKDIGWWIDPCFKKVSIKDSIILKGLNTIELTAKYMPLTEKNTLIYKKDGLEFEPVYIIGDFSVKGAFKEIKNKPAKSDENIIDITCLNGFRGKGFIIIDKFTPDSRDFIRTGYPFYQGGFILKKEFDIDKMQGKQLFLKLKFDGPVVSVKLNDTVLDPIFLPPYQAEITGILQKGKNEIEIEIVNTLRNLLGPHHMKDVEAIFNSPRSFEVFDIGIDNYSFVPFGIKNIRIYSSS